MDDRDPSGRFVRGLTLGALLGAIIAGSSVWRKSKAPRRPHPAPTMSAGDPPDPTDPTDLTRPGADTPAAERPDR